MKILIVTTVPRTFNFFKTQIKEMIQEGHEVHLASNFKKNGYKNSDIQLIKHKIEFSRNIFDVTNIRAYLQFKDLVKKNDFDIIHTHTPIASTIVRLQKRTEAKIIYTAHGFHFYKGAPLKNWMFFYPIERFLSRKTDDLITINSEDYVLANKKFKMKHLHLINGPGIDLKELKNTKEYTKKELGFSETDFLLIFGAELNANKNQKLLIDAMYQLVEKYNNIKLLLVGIDNFNGEYQRYARELKLENHVYFFGMRTDIQKIIKTCDVAVSSSKREGLGLFLIESGVHELPIVATDNRGSREIIKDGKNGFLCSFDVKDIAKKIEMLYINPHQFKENNDCNQESYLKFSDDFVNKKLKKIYEQNMKLEREERI